MIRGIIRDMNIFRIKTARNTFSLCQRSLLFRRGYYTFVFDCGGKVPGVAIYSAAYMSI